ncbi:MAG TPA: DUF1835 domain-containing protein [Salegentibacter sp.]|nr:DUF1835 domain-containing protein [Salegentibacter sp.]
MEGTALHITNGDGLTEKMLSLNLPGQVVIWREMLCEGPTMQEVGSREFIKQRKKFLKHTYGISSEDYEEKFLSQLKLLKAAKDCDYIVLWFEFDLFCHINMIAAISYYLDHKESKPFFLVCSKKLEGDDEFKPLSNLSQKQLLKHYEKRISLNSEDIEIALLIWELYCGNDPMKLKQQIKTNSNFEYLSSCIRAHIERFPNSGSGLNTLEQNVLKLIKNNKITSENQLLGYALQYQGYYGYGDIQMQRLINKLKDFFQHKDEKLELTEKGELALTKKKNYYNELKNEDYFGGARMYDFLYDSDSHRLLKL